MPIHYWENRLVFIISCGRASGTAVGSCLQRLSAECRPGFDRLSTAISTDRSVETTYSKHDPSRQVRRGWQKVCVWQTWQGFTLLCSGLLQKICLKEDEVWRIFFLKNNDCRGWSHRFCPLLPSWGPFLKRPGNFSSLEVNLNIKQLFGPEKLPGLSTNRPHPVTFQARKAALCLPRLHSRSKFQYFWK